MKDHNMSRIFDIIEKPSITEKFPITDSVKKVVFIVSFQSNKPLIKKCLEDMYNIEIEKINIVILRHRSKQSSNKNNKRKPKYKKQLKKAIVTLKKETKIDFYSILN